MGEAAEVIEEVDVREDEAQRIVSWRFDVLSRAGFPPKLAERVAQSRADLHLAAELVSKGCDPRLAARIVI